MNSAVDIITKAMQDAISNGATSAPASLLTHLDGLANPIAALSDHDQGNELFDAFNRDFPFVQLARHRNKPLNQGDHDRLTGLFGWIIVEFRTWRTADDPQNRKLVALFVSTQACDWENALWEVIPADIGSNVELTNRLETLVGSLAANVSSRDPARTPLWEREGVEALQSAEARNDWAAIGNAWPPFAHVMLPNVVLLQATRCLFRCGLTHLVGALANLKQTVVGMMIANALSTTQRLALAAASDNGYVQFCCLYQALSDHRTPKLAFSGVQEQLVTTLLLKVANDESRWAAWMMVFNAYPLRYPALQKALGLALADAPDSAIAPYVNSVVLYPNQDPRDAGRAAVANCLEAFRSKASSPRRSDLWTLAHERWTEWDFNRVDKGQHLLKVNWCQLDYAIVGYACECLDSGGRDAAMNQLVNKLQGLEQSWFESITHIVAEWCRLLSLYQPYAHAEHGVPAGDDWLNVSKQYLPFDPANNQYTVAKFHLA